MDLITTAFLMKLIATGLVFAVLFFILTLVTSEFEYDRYSDFLFALAGWSVLFSALCTVALILMQIWGLNMHTLIQVWVVLLILLGIAEIGKQCHSALYSFYNGLSGFCIAFFIGSILGIALAWITS